MLALAGEYEENFDGCEGYSARSKCILVGSFGQSRDFRYRVDCQCFLEVKLIA